MAAHLVNNREPSMDGDSPGFVPSVFPHSAPDPTAKVATRNERSSRRQEEAAVSSSTLHTDAEAEAASDVKQLLLVKVEAPEETSHAVVLQLSESSYIKEELEEVWIGQEEKQICVKEESSAASFPVSTTSIQSDDTGIISEKDFGGSESAWNPNLNTRVEICGSTKTEVCEDDKEYRSVNNPNFELKRLSESGVNDSECESRASVAKGNNVSKSFFCSDCGEQFNKDSLNRHKIQGCSSGLVGKKSLKFKKTADLQNTVQTIPTLFTCDDCGKAFDRKNNLSQHRRIHTGENPFCCDLCGHSFSLKSSLNKHRRIHTGEKPFRCDICGHSFSQKSHVDRHRRIHTGEKPYHCSFCGHSFSQKSSLDKHTTIHTGEKPFRCDLCGHSFSQKSSLDKHKRIHTGKKPFCCDLCGHSFNHKSSLNKHMIIHTGEKPFRCDLCGHSFSQKSSLDKHKRIHTGEKPFRCDICGHSFSQKSHLDRHRKIHRGEESYSQPLQL